MTDFPERSAALLIGLSYTVDDQLDAAPMLNAPRRDVQHMEALLRFHNLHDITVISDYPTGPGDVDAWARGTKRNIIAALARLVLRTRTENMDFALLYFSGHGLVIGEQEEESVSGETVSWTPEGRHAGSQSEGIAPTDIVQAGPLQDNMIRQLVSEINPSTRLVIIFDCCNSQTLADLRFEYYSRRRKVVNPNAVDLLAGRRVISLSGSLDTQLSEEDKMGYPWLEPVTPTTEQPNASSALTGALYTLMFQQPSLSQNALDLLDAVQTFVRANIRNPIQQPCMNSSVLLDKQSFFPLRDISESRTAAVLFAKSLLRTYSATRTNTVVAALLTSCHQDSLPGSTSAISKHVAHTLSALGTLPAGTAVGDRLSWVFAVAFAAKAAAVAIDGTLDTFWKTADKASPSVLNAAYTTNTTIFADDMAAAVASGNTVNYLINTARRYTAAYTTLLSNNRTKLARMEALFVAGVSPANKIFQSIIEHAMKEADNGRFTLGAGLVTLYTNQSITVDKIKTLVTNLISLYTQLNAPNSIIAVSDPVVTSAGTSTTVQADVNQFVATTISSLAAVGAQELPNALKYATLF